MNEQIVSALKSVRGYWFVDGFTEMATGVVMAFLAIPLIFSGHASPSTFPAWFLSLAGMISIVKLGGVLAAILVLWWLKDHFTYPRTGLVRARRVTAAQVLAVVRGIVLFLLLPVLGLLAVALLLTSSSSLLASMPVWFPVGIGVLWAVLLLWSGEWMGLARFRLLAALTTLAGMAVGAWQTEAGLPSIAPGNLPGLSQPSIVESISRTFMSLGLLSLVCGALLLLSGFVTFVRYRKANPLSYTENG